MKTTAVKARRSPRLTPEERQRASDLRELRLKIALLKREADQLAETAKHHVFMRESVLEEREILLREQRQLICRVASLENAQGGANAS